MPSALTSSSCQPTVAASSGTERGRAGAMGDSDVAAGVEVLPCTYTFDEASVSWLGLAEVLSHEPDASERP